MKLKLFLILVWFILYEECTLSLVLILGMERTPDPDTSGSRCAKPDPRYLTRSSAKVLISRITFYSILTVSFSLWAQSWCQSSKNCCPINRFGTTQHNPLNKADSNHELIQPLSCKTGPRPGPDLSLHTRYATPHRFSLFVPPLHDIFRVFTNHRNFIM